MARPGFIEQDLEHLRMSLDRLYGLVRRILSRSLEGLRSGKPADVEELVQIAEEMKEIVEYTATLFIARYQPLGEELREALSAIRVSYDLYRIARYAREISLLMTRTEGIQPPDDVVEASRIAEEALVEAYKAYRENDEELKRKVMAADDKVDKLYTARLDTLRTAGELPVRDVAALLALRHLERILDHETYITLSKESRQI